MFDFLDSHGIPYERVDHPAVFTCDEARRLVPPIDGAETKNLFLRDGKGHRHFLLSVPGEKVVDLKALSASLGILLASA
jgi:Ala-tRNA(Pro) deacylase